MRRVSDRKFVLSVFALSGPAALFSASLADAQPSAKVAPPGVTTSPAQKSVPTQKVPRPRPSGYLPANQPFDATGFLPPYPARGSAAEAYDIAAWQATSAGAGSSRWKQALADDLTGLNDGLTQFQCAVGVRLTAANAPTLMKLLGKVQLDGHWAVDHAKIYFKRPRPFAQDENAPICLPVPKEMRGRVTTAYPGGHSTLGMSWALVLAELAPDRSDQIMKRAFEYSQSRLVCGIHFPSDLEAGHMLGAALVARLHAEQTFRGDLEVARSEVAMARRQSTRPPTECQSA